MDRDHVGSGTAVIALGLLVGCRSVSPSGVLQCDHLHVVCHGRGRHDRARGSFGRHQHRASAQPAARALPRAAQALSQHGGQARPAHGLMGAHGVAAVPKPVRVNSRLVLVGDGVKIPKRGKKMPAVKLLHQQSESNTKPEYIMGHSLQAVSLLVHAAQSVFAVPLAARIHEGLVWSNRDKRTLLDKMLDLLRTVSIETSFYFVADAYYAAGKVVKGLLNQGHHLLSRVKSNAVAYQPAEPPKGKRRRGAPKRYGKKIKVKVFAFGAPIDARGSQSGL